MRDAVLLASDPASPSKPGSESKKLPPVPRHQAVKKAAERIGVGMEDLRGVMAREGVGLMEAVILAARTRVKGEIEESGGVNGYEKKKKRDNARTAAVAVALDVAQKPPLQSPRHPPANKHSVRKPVQPLLSAESPRKASTIPRAGEGREEVAEKDGKEGDTASRSRTQWQVGKAGGTKALGSPRKKVDSEPPDADDKLTRYREEIRKKADAIWNEADAEPVANAGAALGAGAAKAARPPKGAAVGNSQSGGDIAQNADLKLAFGPPGAKATSPRGDEMAPQHSAGSPVSPAKPTVSPYAVSRPAHNTDMMAAYSNFRKEMKSKVISTMRASHDSTHDASEQPPQQHNSAAQTSSSSITHSLWNVEPHAEQSPKTAALELNTQASQAAHTQPQEQGEQVQAEYASDRAAHVDMRSDKRPDQVRSPASEAGSKARSEAQTRSNSANLDSSTSSLSSITGSHQGTAAAAAAAPAQAHLPHQNVEVEARHHTRTHDDDPLELATGHIPSPHAKVEGDVGSERWSLEANIGSESSSLQKLRFPKIRTDIAVQQARQDLAHLTVQPDLSPVPTASHDVTQSARELGIGDKRPVVAPVPPTARPPSTARSLRVERGGSRPRSSTPRDAMRVVKAGDTSGSSVWSIVAGVRNRLRAGPGR